MDRRPPRRARAVAHDPGRRGRHRRVPRLHRRDQRRAHPHVGDRGVRGRLPRVPDLLGGGGRADPDLRHPPSAGRPAVPGPAGRAQRGRGARPRLQPGGPGGRAADRGGERWDHRVAAGARPAEPRAAGRTRGDRRGGGGRREPGRRVAAGPARRRPRAGGGHAGRSDRHRADGALAAPRRAPGRRCGHRAHRDRRGRARGVDPGRAPRRRAAGPVQPATRGAASSAAGRRASCRGRVPSP